MVCGCARQAQGLTNRLMLLPDDVIGLIAHEPGAVCQLLHLVHADVEPVVQGAKMNASQSSAAAVHLSGRDWCASMDIVISKASPET